MLRFLPRFRKLSIMTGGTPPKRSPLWIGTHNGTFHCDEVVACFMLKQLEEFQNAEIYRSRDDKALREKCDIIVDVGGVYDPAKKWFDHHQQTFKETFKSVRPEVSDDFNVIRLSSAGLVYSHYGERVIQNILKREKGIQLSPENLQRAFVQIYRNFISELDAIDNGVPMFEGGEPVYKISTHLSARIGKLNPSWQETGVDIEERFRQAMESAGREFVDNVVEVACSWITARDHVREALLQAKSIYPSGEILLLKTFCPWKAHLADLEKEYDVEGVPKLVIFNDGNSWRVAGVPVTPSSFLGRKFLPTPWRGLRDEELSQKAGINDLIFVHHNGFIGGAKTEEAAMLLAKKAVEWPVDQ
ncbi:MYG1 protein C694.04c isoform X1 [Drosophila ficusphila]|uniref:MYG1 protein C694.04c isoform X1 n=2 Tax=Drosophila ficusphila TaxID=30025 RepID=UPI0007E6A935|nr:MYG1 protein C694.04c isoform X1 [Drosophila ficusphila]